MDDSIYAWNKSKVTLNYFKTQLCLFHIISTSIIILSRSWLYLRFIYKINVWDKNKSVTNFKENDGYCMS